MRIQIIDDNATNLLLFSRLAQSLGDDLDVAVYLSPVEALASCAENLPDVVLVDYMMPEIDGLEYIRRFRAMAGTADVPLVMVTAAHQRNIQHEALDLGASDFLTKPIDPAEFRARLRNLVALRKNYLRLRNHNVSLTAEVRKAMQMVCERERELVVRLSRAAEFRDPETGGHILRMSHYCQLIARQISLSDEECDMILQASPMHDVGKLGTPDVILLKPGKLDPEEFRIMRQHAEIGYTILSGSNSPLVQAAAEITLSHHEKYDGTGYPQGLKGNEIPLFGRITAVADVFDALTSVRPYKAAWSLDRARSYLEANAGLHFDPVMVDAFMSRWDEVLGIHHRFQTEDEEVWAAKFNACGSDE